MTRGNRLLHCLQDQQLLVSQTLANLEINNPLLPYLICNFTTTGAPKHGSKTSNNISRKVIAPSTTTSTTSTTTTTTTTTSTTTLPPVVVEQEDFKTRRKPVSKTHSKKKRKESKLIYMPLTFVSNAKPFKINSTTGTSKTRVKYSDNHSSYSYSY